MLSEYLRWKKPDGEEYWNHRRITSPCIARATAKLRKWMISGNRPVTANGWTEKEQGGTDHGSARTDRLSKEAPETIWHIKDTGCKMLAGKASMLHHNQVAGLVYRNGFVEFGLETLSSKWDTVPKVVENATILWNFQIQPDIQVMANQPNIVMMEKVDTKAVVIGLEGTTVFVNQQMELF